MFMAVPPPVLSTQSLRNREFRSGLRCGLGLNAKARLVAGLLYFQYISGVKD
jgi:hypothetical protein